MAENRFVRRVVDNPPPQPTAQPPVPIPLDPTLAEAFAFGYQGMLGGGQEPAPPPQIVTGTDVRSAERDVQAAQADADAALEEAAAAPVESRAGEMAEVADETKEASTVAAIQGISKPLEGNLESQVSNKEIDATGNVLRRIVSLEAESSEAQGSFMRFLNDPATVRATVFGLAALDALANGRNTALIEGMAALGAKEGVTREREAQETIEANAQEELRQKAQGQEDQFALNQAQVRQRAIELRQNNMRFELDRKQLLATAKGQEQQMLLARMDALQKNLAMQQAADEAKVKAGLMTAEAFAQREERRQKHYDTQATTWLGQERLGLEHEKLQMAKDQQEFDQYATERKLSQADYQQQLEAWYRKQGFELDEAKRLDLANYYEGQLALGRETNRLKSVQVNFDTNDVYRRQKIAAEVMGDMSRAYVAYAQNASLFGLPVDTYEGYLKKQLPNLVKIYPQFAAFMEDPENQAAIQEASAFRKLSYGGEEYAIRPVGIKHGDADVYLSQDGKYYAIEGSKDGKITRFDQLEFDLPEKDKAPKAKGTPEVEGELSSQEMQNRISARNARFRRVADLLDKTLGAAKANTRGEDPEGRAEARESDRRAGLFEEISGTRKDPLQRGS